MKIAYLVSYPVQYQAPLLRRVAQKRHFGIPVFFSGDRSGDDGLGGIIARYRILEDVNGPRHALAFVAPGFAAR